MRASNDPKQTWIGFCPILGVVHDQLHLAPDALESRLHLEFKKIAGVVRRGWVNQERFQRPCVEQIGKSMSTDSDLDMRRRGMALAANPQVGE